MHKTTTYRGLELALLTPCPEELNDTAAIIGVRSEGSNLLHKIELDLSECDNIPQAIASAVAQCKEWADLYLEKNAKSIQSRVAYNNAAVEAFNKLTAKGKE